MGTSLATLASRRGRRSAATLALLLLLLAGCDAAAGTPVHPVEGLLVLTKGDPARLDLLAGKRDPEKSVAIGLPLPADDITSVSAGDDGVLVASTADGDLATSDPVDPRGSAADIAGLEWTPVEATDEDGAALTGPARFGAWDPDGGRFAALGGELQGGADLSLLLVEPGDGRLTKIDLKRPLLSGPPGLARRQPTRTAEQRSVPTGPDRRRHDQRQGHERTGRRPAPGHLGRRQGHRHLGR